MLVDARFERDLAFHPNARRGTIASWFDRYGQLDGEGAAGVLFALPPEASASAPCCQGGPDLEPRIAAAFVSAEIGARIRAAGSEARLA